MFQILEMTEARLTSVTNRVDKHGDDEVPAVSLGIELTTANTLLDCIDPTLRHALYKAKSDATQELPGVEASTPVLRCNSIESVKLPTSHEGWTLSVDDGIDDTKPMVFGSCKCDKFSVEAKQGGSIVLRFRVGTSDIDAESLGKLGMHNGQSIWITVTAPEKKPDAIDGSTKAFKKDHPEAGDLFAQQHGGTSGPEEGGGDVPAEGDDDEGAAADVEQDTGAAEQAELEAGMSKSIAAAGVKPARRGRKAGVAAE